jgi:ribosomal protein S27AE
MPSGDDVLRRERRRIGATLRREMRARELRTVHSNEQLGLHKNSVYRLFTGEDGFISSYQRLAHALGMRLALLETDDVLPPLETKEFQCPKCGEKVVLAPEDESGRTTCSCGAYLRVKKVVRYVARVERTPKPDGGDDGDAG